MDLGGPQFQSLVFAGAFDEMSHNRNGSAGGELWISSCIRRSGIGDDLQVRERRAVVDFDEGKRFLVADSADPSVRLSPFCRRASWIFCVKDFF